MSGSLNRVMLIGNLARDPESRTSQDGSKIVNITVATSERWKDKSGEQRERAEFHRVVIFNAHIADVAEKYLKKGAKIFCEGQLQTRKWEKDGQPQYTTEVVIGKFKGELTMLDSRGGDASEGGGGGQPRERAAPARGAETIRAAAAQAAHGGNDLDDEIPF